MRMLKFIAAAFAATMMLSPPGVAARAEAPAAHRDGSRDFDWALGAWNTHVERLERPLSGETSWVTHTGTTIVHPFLDGRANLAELSIDSAAGRIEGVSIRLYNPRTHQWSLQYASIRAGVLAPPLLGVFSDGRGEFYGEDTFNDSPILVRFIMSDITANSARFEQAFSTDGGETWEVNWIATDTRR